VHHTQIVRAGQSCAHLLEHVHRALDGHRPTRYFGRERRTYQVFHHQVELAIVRLADVVDVDDVRVVDAVRCARLPQHPGTKVGFAPEVGANQLYGDDAVDEDVTGPIDDAHTSFTNACLEPISASDDLVDERIVALPTAATRLVRRCLNHVYALHPLRNGRSFATASLDVTGNGPE
jgi:hypothetical protein